MNRVIVAEEKHGTALYDASTPELFAKSALLILRERCADCWYTDSDKEWFTQVEELLEKNDLSFQGKNNKIPKAWALLLQRNDAEYENVELRTVINPEE